MTDTSTTVDPWAIRDPDALVSDRPCVQTTDPDEDGPWGKRCSTHDQPWTSSIGCEAAQRRVRAQIAEQRARTDHERRKRAEASRAGLLALIEPGATIYSSTHKAPGGEFAVGGVVVAVEDFADAETGERERRYHVLDSYGRGVTHRVIPEWDVDRHSIAATPASTMARLFRRVAWDLWKAGKPTRDGRVGRTSIDSRDADRVRWLVTLAKLLMGGA